MGCEDRNKYQPPPAPEVGVEKPQRRPVTLYLELTGNTTAFNKVDLVARVQGFLDKVGYKDGEKVAAGATLFEIERAPYETSLQIAEASRAQQEALLVQAEAEFNRQLALQQRQVASEARLEESRSKRDATVAALEQAKGQVQQAKINLGYTEIKAPFAGVVTARLVDPGSLVGAGGPTKLATIVQIDPIYVNFNVNSNRFCRFVTSSVARA
jgi:RND family efflux transporter MFP subunit